MLPPSHPPHGETLPYLGGTVLVDETHAGKRFLGGTHGLLIIDRNAVVR